MYVLVLNRPSLVVAHPAPIWGSNVPLNFGSPCRHRRRMNILHNQIRDLSSSVTQVRFSFFLFSSDMGALSSELSRAERQAGGQNNTVKLSCLPSPGQPSSSNLTCTTPRRPLGNEQRICIEQQEARSVSRETWPWRISFFPEQAAQQSAESAHPTK